MGGITNGSLTQASIAPPLERKQCKTKNKQKVNKNETHFNKIKFDENLEQNLPIKLTAVNSYILIGK